MQHCIVNLYRSVSKREKMPSGKFAGSAVMILCRVLRVGVIQLQGCSWSIEGWWGRHEVINARRVGRA